MKYRDLSIHIQLPSVEIMTCLKQRNKKMKINIDTTRPETIPQQFESYSFLPAML
jgi:hypothetical protein